MTTDDAPEPGKPGPTGGFVCVCVQKGVEFDIVDHRLHRANKERELHEELSQLTDLGPSIYAYQTGGGCRVVERAAATGPHAKHPVYIASYGGCVCVFEGTLDNLADLAVAYPDEAPADLDAGGKETAGDAAAAAAAAATKQPTTPALVICVMYGRVAIELLKKLRGKFSFCLYHGKTGRVLSARDSSGEVPLFQGMSAAESLVIGSDAAFTATCHDVVEFEPGYFKFGWYAEPRKFAPESLTNHHYGHTNVHSLGASRRGSMDAGSRRASIDVGSRRGSIDTRGSVDHRSVKSGSAAVPPHRRASMDTKSSATRAAPQRSATASDLLAQQAQRHAGDGGSGWATSGARSTRTSMEQPGGGSRCPLSGQPLAGGRRSIDVVPPARSSAPVAVPPPLSSQIGVDSMAARLQQRLVVVSEAAASVGAGEGEQWKKAAGGGSNSRRNSLGSRPSPAGQIAAEAAAKQGGDKFIFDANAPVFAPPTIFE
ncbi:hypothetical protein FOA52_011179 [Chlamydomonas sp. UWO 241]|nr:hypothetical protein FOA52_011179 [Chlamydomonas sp. UWO 241]